MLIHCYHDRDGLSKSADDIKRMSIGSVTYEGGIFFDLRLSLQFAANAVFAYHRGLQADPRARSRSC